MESSSRHSDASATRTLHACASFRGCRRLPAPVPQDKDGRVVGAAVRDNLSGRTQAVYAKTVVNAAGPFVDEVRQLSEVRPLLSPDPVGQPRAAWPPGRLTGSGTA